MPAQRKSYLRGIFSIIIIFTLLFSLSGCGAAEEEPAPQQPAAASEAPAEPAEEAEATEAVPPPAEAPAAEAPPAAAYTHLTGAFQMNPLGELQEEYRDAAVFNGEQGMQIVFFQGSTQPLDEANLAEALTVALDQYLVGSGLATRYELDANAAEPFAEGYLAPFTASDDSGASAQGGVFLRQAGGTLFTVLLLTGDYAAADEAFRQSLSSLAAAETADVAQAEADSGFRPNVHGFSFPNYTGDEFPVTNLTAVEMERMFGPQVCASQAGGVCTLTPPAQRWMDERNQSMSGGHCEGFSVLGSLMYYGQVDPNQFGAPVPYELTLADNEPLQREIAYWFTTQYTFPGGVNKINESPAAVVAALLEIMQSGANAAEQFAVGIYQRDFQGGHSVLPIGVDDKGGGLYDILVYDNNWPDQVRAIQVDTNANTWTYEASINPNEQADTYEGDASTQTLELVTIGPRLEQQVCDFCAGGSGGSKGGRGLGQAAQDYYEITLDGPANLLIETEDGKRIGYFEGQFINEVENASAEHPKLGVNVWSQDLEPVYRLPATASFVIAVDASELSEASTNSVSVIGPGYYLAVEDIELDAGEVDLIAITSEGSTYAILYLTDYAETPDVYVGIETAEADYAFLARAVELSGEEDTLNIFVDLNEQWFAVSSETNTAPGVYEFYLLRIDDEGEQAFGAEDFTLEPAQTVYLDYAQWPGNGSPLVAELDTNGDGVPDQTVELPDSSDAFEW
jgi:hypothetical protein